VLPSSVHVKKYVIAANELPTPNNFSSVQSHREMLRTMPSDNYYASENFASGYTNRTPTEIAGRME
jgi:hypothetical protein